MQSVVHSTQDAGRSARYALRIARSCAMVPGGDVFGDVPEKLGDDQYRAFESGLDEIRADNPSWGGVVTDLADLTEEDVRELEVMFPTDTLALSLIPFPSSQCCEKVLAHEERTCSERAPRSFVVGLPVGNRVPRRRRDRMRERIPHDTGSSLCDKRYIPCITGLFGTPDDLQVTLPNADERPWDCPAGYLCVYVDYLTDCGLWCPIPEFLTSYCARRKIAFSQLSISSIRNAVGLTIMAGLTIVSGQKSHIHDWRRRFFYVEINDASIEDPDTICPPNWNFAPVAVAGLGKKSSFSAACDLGTVDKAASFISCSRTGLQMGDCPMTFYADLFDAEDAPAIATDVVVPNAETDVEIVAVEGEDGELPVPKGEPSRRSRSAEVAGTRAAKMPSSVSHKSAPAAGGGDRARKRTSRSSPRSDAGGSSRRPHRMEDGHVGIDHSFSFRYDVKDQAFTGDSSACADLASKIHGDFVLLPTPGNLACPTTYEEAALSWMNRLAGDYEDKVRVARREASLIQDAFVQAERSSKENATLVKELMASLKQSQRKLTTESERLRKARDERGERERAKAAVVIGMHCKLIDLLRRHVIASREKQSDLLLLSQVTGTRQCLEKLIKRGIAIPEDRMLRLAASEEEFRTKVNQVAVPPLFDSDLEPFPESADGGGDDAANE
ncbi:PREDICTED: uncharacterized protein At3g60930, chloroplastic-like [Camelina sativa]|uniref:Uncharacterized protein At3g60930, chloroplastic-like n=1 Tax=Camelina sativa TaxID=90675 RepID=A0ABM1QL86_CAMSA|nr:PREDICTED: uncharacterized protein At3g60930, chloroplastic-like [Camelina sativa]